MRLVITGISIYLQGNGKRFHRTLCSLGRKIGHRSIGKLRWKRNVYSKLTPRVDRWAFYAIPIKDGWCIDMYELIDIYVDLSVEKEGWKLCVVHFAMADRSPGWRDRRWNAPSTIGCVVRIVPFYMYICLFYPRHLRHSTYMLDSIRRNTKINFFWEEHCMIKWNETKMVENPFFCNGTTSGMNEGEIVREKPKDRETEDRLSWIPIGGCSWTSKM